MVDDDDERAQHKRLDCVCVYRDWKKGESQRLYKCLSIDEGNRHVKREQKKKPQQNNRRALF